MKISLEFSVKLFLISLFLFATVCSREIADELREQTRTLTEKQNWSVRHVWVWIQEAGWNMIDTVNQWSPFRWIGGTMKDFSLRMAAKNLAQLLATPVPNASDARTVSSWNTTTQRYFSNMKLLNVDECLSLLLCRVAGNVTHYGVLGRQLAKFFHVYNFSGDNRSTEWWFVRAYQIGQNALVEDIAGCREQFDHCKRNVVELVPAVLRRLADSS